MTTKNLKISIKSIIAHCCILLFLSSCITEKDKNKCCLIHVGVVDKTYSSETGDIAITTPDGSSYYPGTTKYFIVINEKCFEYCGYTFPEKKILQEGDYAWVLKDWKERTFCSASSDIKSAINAYVKYQKIMTWEVIVVVVVFGLIIPWAIVASNSNE